MLVPFLSLAPAALQLPSSSSRAGDITPDRRAVLQIAASSALLPLLPGAATASSGGVSVVSDDRIGSGFGGTGALRSDLGEAVKGSGVELAFSELSYTELKACPPKFFLPNKGGPWDCIEVSATVLNQGKRTPTAADVFGQIYDAENYACIATSLDPSQKAPIATLIEPFPKGKSKQVNFVVAVQARSPRPFRFAGFKGSYRSAAMERVFQTFDDCEIDSSKCAEDEDQPENAKAIYEGRGFQYR